MPPTNTAADWKHQPLAKRHLSQAPVCHLDTTESACMRKGGIPLEMEDEWSLYYEGNTFYMHRRWT